MKKSVINTTGAPSPIGPYSQAVRAGDLLFISGQIPMNPETGEMVVGNIKEETRQVMGNIAAILEKAGITFNEVVKTTIFLTDMAFFPDINEVYGSYLSSDFPARETVAVLALPKQSRVEISVVAIFPKEI